MFLALQTGGVGGKGMVRTSSQQGCAAPFARVVCLLLIQMEHTYTCSPAASTNEGALVHAHTLASHFHGPVAKSLWPTGGPRPTDWGLLP